MSRPYKIFTMQHNPDQMQGRNANIAQFMMKKAQLGTSQVSERTQLNPFSGYSYASNGDSLASSMVSEYGQNQSQQSLRKLIKQQVERRLKDDKQKNDFTIMKAEIRSLKESFQQISKDYNQRLNESYVESKEETQIYVDRLLQQHQKQTKNNLKKVVSITRDEIKKQLIGYMGRQFIPLNFIDDLEKQLNEIQDRIEYIENKIKTTEIKPSKDPVILADLVDLRMNKLDRQIQSLRKSVIQLPNKIKTHDENIASIMQMTEEEKEATKFELQRIMTTINNHETEMKKISNLEMTTQNLKLDVDFFKGKLQDLDKWKSEQSTTIFELQKSLKDGSAYSNEIKELLKNKNNLSTTLSSNNSSSSRPQEKLSRPDSHGANKPYTPSPGKPQVKISFSSSANPTGNSNAPVTNQTNLMGNPIKNPPSNSLQKEREQSRRKSPMPSPRKNILENVELASSGELNPTKTLYKIDSEGYLMDSEGKYLIDEDNKMIKLSEDKIKMLEQSNLIEFV